jgi:hypothetical protein
LTPIAAPFRIAEPRRFNQPRGRGRKRKGGKPGRRWIADFELPETDADVIVLAGDIGVGMSGLEWMTNERPSKHFIYVPGNHEFHGHDISPAGESSENLPFLAEDEREQIIQAQAPLTLQR